MAKVFDADATARAAAVAYIKQSLTAMFPIAKVGVGRAVARCTTHRLQGCSFTKGELETPNSSIFLIRRVSSSPFLAEPPCTYPCF